jgi:hypothetical protein
MLVVAIFAIAFAAFASLVQRKNAVVERAISQLQPGLTQADVRAILIPLRADMMIKGEKEKEGKYLVRGIDEFIIVVMDGDAQDARVSEVKHVPDVGPWWERWRRNWEARFR